MKIVVIGELNADLVLQNYHSFPALGREVLVDDVSLTLGSASAICAAGLAKLGNEVLFFGKVGCDSWGEFCLESLHNLGIDCSSVICDRHTKTGLTVSITSARDRALVTYLGSIAELRASEIGDEMLAGARHLHISSFFLQQQLRPGLKTLLARAHRLGLTTSIDPGFDPEEQWSQDLLNVLQEVDVFLPNEVELTAITKIADYGGALSALQNGNTITVAKLGAVGCMAMTDVGVIYVPALSVNAMDTTGAGDSFNAGFLHAWLRGEPLEAAMRFAAACGALSTLSPGGTTGQADEVTARAFMAGVVQ